MVVVEDGSVFFRPISEMEKNYNFMFPYIVFLLHTLWLYLFKIRKKKPWEQIFVCRGVSMSYEDQHRNMNWFKSQFAVT